MATLFAFLHHVAAFALVAALTVELVLLRDTLTLETARKLVRMDMVYGIAAGIVLIVGLGRVFHFEKGGTYYLHSWPFLAKLALFIGIGVISSVPTREFMSWRAAVSAGRVPEVRPEKLRSLRSIVHVELLGVVLILLCAAMMARGVGMRL